MADLYGPGYGGDFNPVQPAGTFSSNTGATDISGAGGGFDWANFNWAGIGNTVNGFIGTVGGLILAGQNNTPYTPYGQAQANPYTPYGQAQANPYAGYVPTQPQQPQGISTTTIVVLVFLLLLIVAVVYFLNKGKKG